ncbi:MAG TPA: hypothetical protein VIL26_05260 [Clostridia bacterium]
MFKKLRKKIIIYMMCSTAVFITVLGITSYFIVRTNVYKNFVQFSHQNITQSINSSLFYINSSVQSASMITNNNIIIEELKKDEESTIINPILNNVTNSSFGAMCSYLYDIKGHIYQSSNIGYLPSLDAMNENQHIAEFFADEKKSFISIRTSPVFGIYDNIKYSEEGKSEYGIISYIEKIIDEDDSLLGYLFVDINPKKIYDNFFNYKEGDIFEAQSYIISDNEYIKYINHSYNVPYEKIINSQNDTQYILDNKYLVITYSVYTDYTVLVTLIPLSQYRHNMIVIAVVILVLSAIMIIASYYIASYTAKKITNPLERLVNKMQNSKL